MMALVGNLKQNFCQAQFEKKVNSQPKIIVHQQYNISIWSKSNYTYLYYIILEPSFVFFRPFFINLDQLVKTLSKHYSICHFVHRNQKKPTKYAEEKAEMAFNVMDR